MGVLFSSLRWGNLSSSGIFTFSRLRNLFTATRKIAVAAEKKTIKAAEEPKHILIVGGAYSGLATIITIQKILGGALHSPGPYNLPEVKILPRVAPRITLLDERDGIYHTVGTPLAHTSPDVKTVLPRTWKKYSDIEYLKDVEVIHGRVDTLDASRKEVHYTAAVGDKKVVLSYDYLVCGTGLKRAWPIQPRATTKEEFIRDATELVQGLVDAKERIVVVGGG